MPRPLATIWLTPEDVQVTVTPTPTGYKVECEYTYKDHYEVERRYARTRKHAERLACQFHERAAENGSPEAPHYFGPDGRGNASGANIGSSFEQGTDDGLG